MTSIAGKKCLITGAASGIGRATAIMAAARGAELFLTDIAAPRLKQTAAEITASGGRVRYTRALDISDHEAVVAMADEVHAAHGSLDIVMNIAGISAWGSVENLEHRHWRQMVEVNLMGPIHVIECFIPAMIEADRGGHLVNVSSAAGLFGLPWHAAYSASKFGLRGVSEVLRFDLRRHGIGVSLVCPGGVATPLVGTVEIAGIDREHRSIKKLTAHFERRAVSPKKVAAAILKGVQRNRYMVFTSPDIWVGYFFQRKFALPYEIVMRIANDRLVTVAKRSIERPS